eukprot:COSAG02_NODE_466_length_21773_cov_71.190966_13_plen_111_part_00
MEELKRSRGEPVGLNRQPCDVDAFTRVIGVAKTAVGLRLKQAANQLLQLLGWFRADTMRGFQPGDVFFDTWRWWFECLIGRGEPYETTKEDLGTTNRTHAKDLPGQTDED